MLDFQVNDMTCNHCAGAITRAIQAIDAGARVQVDLEAKRVQVDPATADAPQVAAAIEEAGYTPERLA